MQALDFSVLSHYFEQFFWWFRQTCDVIPDLVANYPKHALHSLQIKDVIWIPDMGSGIIIPFLIINFSQQAASSLMFRLRGKAFG
jgi:hypothetical protein